ncbi:MAG: O-antigen ligase family protein [Thermoleophilia bacterium]
MTAESVWALSLTGRLTVAVSAWLGPAWAASLVGRILTRTWSVFLRYASGSLIFSLPPSFARGPGAEPCSLTGKAAFGVYRWLARVLGQGAPGATARRVGAGVEGSLLEGAAWIRPLGGTLAAFAVVRAAATWSGHLPFGGPDTGTYAPVAYSAALAVLGVAGSLALVLGSGAPVVRSGRRGRVTFLPTAVVTLFGATLGIFAGLTPGVGAAFPLVLAAGVVAAACVLYRPEVLLVALAAFPWLDWGARRALGGTALGGVWDEAFLLGSFVALFFAVFLVRRADLWVTPLLAPLALAVTAAIGSVVVMDVPTGVAVFALRVTFQPLLFFFLAQLLPRDRRWVRMAVLVFLSAGLLMALHGLFQYATHAPMPAKWVDARETAISTRAYSIVENPNGLGAFLLLGSMLAASLALARIALRIRLFAAGAFVVLAAGVAVTFSRGAWLGFVVGVVALAALSMRRLLAGIVVAGFAAPLVAPGAFIDRLTFAFSSEYLAKSASAGRLLSWSTAAQRIVDHPWFGVGLGTFGGTSSFLYGYSKIWVDDFYLQLAAEGGLILLVAFVWLLLRTAKGVVAGYRRQTDPFSRAVAAGVFGGCAAVAFANLTAGVWETLVVGAGFWFLAGLASGPGLGSETAREAAADFESGPPAGVAAGS